MIKYIGKCLLVVENSEKILVIGDLHLGFEEVLNQSGILVGRKMFEEILFELSKIFEKVGKVNKIVLLGDVKHSFGKIVGQEWKEILDLIDYLNSKLNKNGALIIIKGNHDKILGPVVAKRDLEIHDYFIFGKYCFLHGHRGFEEIYDRRVKSWILGHGHPAVKISEGIKIEKYKCFLEGEFNKMKVVLVPSFFEYNQGSDPRENDLGYGFNFNLEKFNVKIVSDELTVLDFGKLENLK